MRVTSNFGFFYIFDDSILSCLLFTIRKMCLFLYLLTPVFLRFSDAAAAAAARLLYEHGQLTEIIDPSLHCAPVQVKRSECGHRK